MWSAVIMEKNTETLHNLNCQGFSVIVCNCRLKQIYYVMNWEEPEDLAGQHVQISSDRIC